MEVRFLDESLDRLEVDGSYDAGFSRPVVKAFRKFMQYTRAARDERDYYDRKGYHFEKLKGDRAGQHSIMLNDQWRVVMKIRKSGSKTIVDLLGIVDYH
ncbi:MAG: type II toxin-antitoxin system RelE/ParE family toxin [Acidobacteria bacterium]|nr:type II toxin-antitoxin system RelE/ParE family toxin [Acidobacteriota bacterium]